LEREISRELEMIRGFVAGVIGAILIALVAGYLLLQSGFIPGKSRRETWRP
jgi:hypothetical protein